MGHPLHGQGKGAPPADYLPQLGRYIEPDPLRRMGSGNNFYVYVGDNPINEVDPFGLAALSLDQITNLVAKNNYSGLSNELITCMIYKESTFDPDAIQPYPNTARGLMGITAPTANWFGSYYNRLGEAAYNIEIGTQILQWKIRAAHGNVKTGLANYGTGRSYANALEKCEKCLKKDAKLSSECKTNNCLLPLHGGK